MRETATRNKVIEAVLVLGAAGLTLYYLYWGIQAQTLWLRILNGLLICSFPMLLVTRLYGRLKGILSYTICLVVMLIFWREGILLLSYQLFGILLCSFFTERGWFERVNSTLVAAVAAFFPTALAFFVLYEIQGPIAPWKSRWLAMALILPQLLIGYGLTYMLWHQMSVGGFLVEQHAAKKSRLQERIDSCLLFEALFLLLGMVLLLPLNVAHLIRLGELMVPFLCISSGLARRWIVTPVQLLTYGLQSFLELVKGDPREACAALEELTITSGDEIEVLCHTFQEAVSEIGAQGGRMEEQRLVLEEENRRKEQRLAEQQEQWEEQKRQDEQKMWAEQKRQEELAAQLGLLQKEKQAHERAAAEAEEHAREVIAHLPSVEGVDWRIAWMNLPDEEKLRSTVLDFYQRLPEAADKLVQRYDRLPAEGAREAYYEQILAMKAEALVLGILPLTGLAGVLEAAARDDQLNIVWSMHEIFLREWRSYCDKLAVFAQEP